MLNFVSCHTSNMPTYGDPFGFGLRHFLPTEVTLDGRFTLFFFKNTHTRTHCLIILNSLIGFLGGKPRPRYFNRIFLVFVMGLDSGSMVYVMEICC